MARALFINAGSEGHINPTIGVVKELISRGEEVVYVCVDAYRERMEKTGATVLTLDDQRFIQAFAGVRLNMQSLTAELREAVDQVLGDESFKTAAAGIRESLAASGGYRQAVDEIFAYKVGK
ncbi:hypothetical protein A8990_12590 [Paenibacillus taihuensis]|uniref:MGT family glycosyltransferase n=1 Tax=Paenibacillus taihuensis TaxID=1156355 RepID=A0A3D9RPL3_9BACL|nr:hypothetical protein A8990_12590 [Paenibacillus taihuensis]